MNKYKYQSHHNTMQTNAGLFFLLAGILMASLSHPLRAEVPVLINYMDEAGEGFYDPTLGEARRAAFKHAVNIWATEIEGTIAIEIDAEFNSLGGDANAATLGLTGPSVVNRDFINAPMQNTWYVPALANQLAGDDLLPSDADIAAEFNSDVDGDVVLGSNHWYYGLDANAPGNDIDFVSIVLHELAHGLGFLDLIDPDTGRWFGDTPDIYGLQLTVPGVGGFDTISRFDRLDALTSDNLFWKGPHVVANHGSQIKMYAPDPYDDGSSITHWDPSNTPDLLMEPYAISPGHGLDLTPAALADLGWSLASVDPVDSAANHWDLYY